MSDPTLLNFDTEPESLRAWANEFACNCPEQPDDLTCLRHRIIASADAIEWTRARLRDLTDIDRKIRELTYTPEDGLTLALEPDVFSYIMASSLERFLGDRAEAPNYRSAEVSWEISPPGTRTAYVVTVTRPDGKRPDKIAGELKRGVRELLELCEDDLYCHDAAQTQHEADIAVNEALDRVIGRLREMLG